MSKIGIHHALAGGSLLILMAGCASVPEPYIPSHVGSMQDSLARDGLQIEIRPVQTRAVIGETIEFEINVRNASEQPFWVANKPDVLFTWVYPDGHKDHFLRDLDSERFYTKDEVRLLAPGETIRMTARIPTYYFRRPGITEFRAVLHCPENKNPSMQPFWCGRAHSNAFGVMLEAPARAFGLSFS